MIRSIRWLFVVMVFVPLSGWAANVSNLVIVPGVVRFAGIRLKLTSSARKRVQAKVDQLTVWKKMFNQILDRTNLFFPLIEKTLAEENVPDDFKFQALHESMLIGDCISPTNDVGFWQIHKVAAEHLKLNIDYPIDERMHLIQSTKAAARFLKGHNQYFDSWLGALLAYNKGRAAAVKVFPKKYYGAKIIQLDDKTDQYIISVIATKLAFGMLAGKNKHSKLHLFVYNRGHHGQKLEDIATHLKVEEKLLSEYNRWLRTTTIPHNTNCALVVPLPHTHFNADRSPTLELPKQLNNESPKGTETAAEKKKLLPQRYSINYEKHLSSPIAFPKITPLKDLRSTRLIKANGRLAIVAKQGDSIAHLAKLANLDVKKFLLINEIKETHLLIPGTIYYYSAKGNKGGAHYHVVALGEDLWGIAQRYGIKQSALLEKNRIKDEGPLEEGRILWLRFIRPCKIPVEYK